MGEKKKKTVAEQVEDFQKLSENGQEKISKGEAYFQERMALLGVTNKINKVKLWEYDAESKQNVLKDQKIFTSCEKGISIIVYNIDRQLIRYRNDEKTDDGQEVVKRGIVKEFKLIRYHTPWIDDKGKLHKYHIPKGAGTYPFFPPALIRKYEAKEKGKTLVLTEGYFKAFKASMYGLDVVGLSSITHFRDKEKGTLHSDIIKLIRQCQYENIIWLADADCNNISLDALSKTEDIYYRPNQFFNTCTAIKRMLDDYDIFKYFAYIKPNLTPEHAEVSPKGLDDLLIAYPGKEKEILEDLLAVSKPASWFWREDMSFSVDKIRKHFRLHNINEFVEFHNEQIREAAEKNGIKDFPDIKKKPFIWNGTKYEWDNEKSESKIIVPGDASNYFRVGDQYHKKIEIPNKYKDLEKTFHRRQKQTIIDDYGKDFVRHIPKYEAFCNVPDHVNYQPVHHNCYNMYFPFEHVPEEGDCFYTMSFLKHIFGEKNITVRHKQKGELTVNELDLGLDYVQLLYQHPQQVLPILCLVSKENETGKSTFAKWLKYLFTQNVAIVGNADLANDFNASWAGRLIVICEEAKIDKAVVVEKVKALSTADKIFMNAKGKDHVEIDFFAKFLFMTNNEENFIYAGEEDVRYWIRKVPVIQTMFVDMIEEMKSEASAFLYFLNKRKMTTERLSRSWFYHELIKTDALKKVIAFSRSTVEKELRQHIRDMFFDHGVHEIRMTMDAINETFFRNKYERNYLRNVLTEHLKVDVFHEFDYNGKSFSTVEELQAAAGDAFTPDLVKSTRRNKICRYHYPKVVMTGEPGKQKRDRVNVSDIGRPYVFKIEKFLLKEEIETRWIDPETADFAKMSEKAEPQSWGETGDAQDKQTELPLNGVRKPEDLPF